jgi:multiple sugar transport system permease protein
MRRRSKSPLRGGIVAAAPFILPGLLLVCAFVLYPMAKNIAISFADYNLVEDSLRFTGAANYDALFNGAQGRFWYAYRNNLLYAAVTTPCTILLGLLSAVMINGLRKGGTFFRTVYYIPMITSWIIVGLVFKYLFNPSDRGLVNYALVNVLHFLKGPVNWLKEEWPGNAVIWMLGTFKGVAYPMIVFLAALQSISRELYEAAEVEGCGFFRRIAAITAPLIRPTIFFLVVQSLIGSFNVFLQVLILTVGDPSGRTSVLQYLLYDDTFNLGQFGQGAAIGVITAASIAVFAVLLNRFVAPEEDRRRVPA